ncbi:MAG: hypothetical protein CMH54_04245 [Myxococcales bacterium]|nr:hypothetical protein [Myxococcales bacterium]
MVATNQQTDTVANTPRVSAVLAAYNEALSIDQVIHAVRSATPNLCEVLVVDDGSVDGTAAVAEEAGARVIRHIRNEGKGVALRTGIQEAQGEVVLFIDADGQDDPNEIPRLFEALTPQTDLVIGSRFLGRFEKGAIGPLNYMGNRTITWLFDRIFKARLTDTQAGFRVLRKDALGADRLRSKTYEIETEMTAQVLENGGTVVEVPVSRYARTAGKTSFQRIPHGMRIVWTMVSIRARNLAKKEE